MRDYPKVTDDKGVEIRVGDIVTTEGELSFESMSQAKRIELTSKWNWDMAEEGSRERHIAPIYQRMPDGIVTHISDFDGDVDDEGRSIGINPYVYVRWPGEDEDESFGTCVSDYGRFYPSCYDSDEITMMCEDLRVIKRDYSHERGETAWENALHWRSEDYQRSLRYWRETERHPDFVLCYDEMDRKV